MAQHSGYTAMNFSIKDGWKECTHCNGYGSSLKERQPICSKCNGTGIVKKDEVIQPLKEAHSNPNGETST